MSALCGFEQRDDSGRARRRRDCVGHAQLARHFFYDVGDGSGDGSGLRVNMALNRVCTKECRAQSAGGREIRRP